MKISIEKAVEITDTCLCCNTIKEIQKELEDYNRKNNTNYTIEMQYMCYTTTNCGVCNMVKNLISAQNLKICIKESDENDVDYLIQNKISTFPVLRIKAGEKNEFISGKTVGEFIASNLNMFK